MGSEFGNFFSSDTSQGGGYQPPGQQNSPLDNSGGQGSSQQSQSGQGNDGVDLHKQVQDLQQQLQQEQQWKQNLGRFIGGDQNQGIDPRLANDQLRQLLQDNPAAVLNTYGENLTAQTERVAQQAAQQTFAVQSAVNHFNTNYTQYAEYGPEVEFQVANVVEELKSTGKVGTMSPTQVIDEAVKRFEQRFGVSPQRQQSNPRVIASLDIASVQNPRIGNSQNQGNPHSGVDWNNISSQDFAAKRRQILNQSY